MNFDRFVQEYSYAQLGLLKLITLNPASFKNTGLFRRFLSYIKNYIFVDFELIENDKFADGNHAEVVLLCVNNENESVNLYGLLGDVGKISLHSCGRYNPITRKNNTIPRFWLFISLFISPFLLMYYIYKYRKIKHLKYSADRILIGFSYYKFFKNYLKKNKFSKIKIVISNHCNPVSDALLQAASSYPGIVTYYIEHCPLIENWPPIKVDYLVLATDLSLQRIGNTWTNNKLLFISTTKYDVYSRVLNDVIGIGVAISPNDEMLCIQAALRFLRSNFKDPIIVRCHPELGNSRDKILTDLDLDIIIMNPKNFSVVDFLSTIRTLAVSDSGIFFDSWSAGVLPVKVRFGEIWSEYTVKDSVFKGLHSFDAELIKIIKTYSYEDRSEEIRNSFIQYMSIRQSNLREFKFSTLSD